MKSYKSILLLVTILGFAAPTSARAIALGADTLTAVAATSCGIGLASTNERSKSNFVKMFAKSCFLASLGSSLGSFYELYKNRPMTTFTETTALVAINLICFSCSATMLKNKN